MNKTFFIVLVLGCSLLGGAMNADATTATSFDFLFGLDLGTAINKVINFTPAGSTYSFDLAPGTYTVDLGTLSTNGKWFGGWLSMGTFTNAILGSLTSSSLSSVATIDGVGTGTWLSHLYQNVALNWSTPVTVTLTNGDILTFSLTSGNLPQGPIGLGSQMELFGTFTIAAGAPPTGNTPVPPTVFLLGAGLLGAVVLRRKGL